MFQVMQPRKILMTESRRLSPCCFLKSGITTRVRHKSHPESKFRIKVTKVLIFTGLVSAPRRFASCSSWSNKFGFLFIYLYFLFLQKSPKKSWAAATRACQPPGSWTFWRAASEIVRRVEEIGAVVCTKIYILLWQLIGRIKFIWQQSH